jgi:DNA invertase Pin-like site-specific DNA recombinase
MADEPTYAFGYVRLSRADQDSTSPQRQRQAIEDYCSSHGWELVETFEDLDVSGRADRRPGLDRMLARLGDMDRIVFWKLDRLYRGMVGFGKIVEACQANEVALVSTSEPFDTGTPMGEAMMWLLGVFAQLEIRVMGERSKNMHTYLKANGKWASRIPFGWQKDSDGRLRAVEAEQAVLRDMAERLVSGDSLRDVGRRVGMEHTTVRHMLRSDRVLDALPPELAANLRGVLRQRGEGYRGNSKSLLAGIARCGVCSGPMKIFARRQPGDREGTWSAYGCRDKGHVYISQPWLDAHVSSAVLSAIDKGKLARRFDRKKKRPREAADIEARIEKLEDDYYQRGLLSEKSYLRQREGLLRRLEAAREDDSPRGGNLPRELALHLEERWGDLTVGERRRIILAALEGVEVARATTKTKVDPSRVRLVWL